VLYEKGRERVEEGVRFDGGAVNKLLVGLRSSKVRHMDPTDIIVH
jgi:hypothetical protein